MGLLRPAPLGLARVFYNAKIAAGKSHHAILPALGKRRLEVL